MSNIMTPEYEANIIAEMFEDLEIVVFRVGAGVLEFEDESAQEVKRFRLTVEEI